MFPNFSFSRLLVCYDECVFHASGLANIHNTRIRGTKTRKEVQQYWLRRKKQQSNVFWTTRVWQVHITWILQQLEEAVTIKFWTLFILQMSNNVLQNNVFQQEVPVPHITRAIWPLSEDCPRTYELEDIFQQVDQQNHRKQQHRTSSSGKFKWSRVNFYA